MRTTFGERCRKRIWDRYGLDGMIEWLGVGWSIGYIELGLRIPLGTSIDDYLLFELNKIHFLKDPNILGIYHNS